ncbi:hypothetical protein F5148DRAFT_1336361 [Russula earlei]|uniref:Uncharacterized protein n=1 Tax=Russula earlei TaxID=71964 RepID=A0ACC0TX99_9AGAM|nr:hypothetical protein F5148DRAFT_1336361 [Russula earlei]
MQLKRIIAVICLLVLTIQVLPVKQIGSVLFGNQVNEELPHSLGLEKKADCKCFPFKDDPFLAASGIALYPPIYSGNQYIHFTITLPASHEGDIPTPPPNIGA